MDRTLRRWAAGCTKRWVSRNPVPSSSNYRHCFRSTHSPAGLILQSIVAYWFHVRYGVQPAALGGIFFGGNILAGISALSASWLARRIGLINTMVFTHIPSNILVDACTAHAKRPSGNR